MKNLLAKNWIKLAAVAALLLAGALSLAHAGADAQDTSRVPMPDVTAVRGKRCVEPTEFMRKNHMKLLMHHRISAVHQGDNQLADKYSIVNCVNCHASARDNSVTGQGDFCQSCHAYAAVTITCFECHSSKPSGTPSSFHPLVSLGSGDKATRASTRATMMRYQAYHGKLPNLQAKLSVKDLAGVMR